MNAPYYQDSHCTIYHGDCLDILQQHTVAAEIALREDSPLVLVTDPPYGVGLGTQSDQRSGHGLKLGAYDGVSDSYEYFIAEVVPRINLAIGVACRSAVFTGPHIHEQHKPDAIGGVFCPAASGRHCWGFKSLLPVLFYGKAPDLNKGSRATAIQSTEVAERSNNAHPVPKPLGWMKWLISLCSRPSEIILDPFMGSGTTLVAAKELGRKAIGIEISKEYCDIAVKRLRQEVLF